MFIYLIYNSTDILNSHSFSRATRCQENSHFLFVSCFEPYKTNDFGPLCAAMYEVKKRKLLCVVKTVALILP